MQHIISFIINNKYFLLFLFLEIIAISLTIQSHSYHRSKFINSSNAITGSVYNSYNSFSNYLSLKDYNEQLFEENTKLKNLLSDSIKDQTISTRIDSLTFNSKYRYLSARIINNQYHKLNNRLTINKGGNDGVTAELAVISSKGIIGITTNVSSNYSVVMPITNKNTRINVKLLNNHHFGTISWDGANYNVAQFEDLPRQANIKIGDTIITGGKSAIFPEGILIGTIKDFNISNNSYETINVQLFNDMSAVYYVNIITNLDKKEINTLENE